MASSLYIPGYARADHRPDDLFVPGLARNILLYARKRRKETVVSSNRWSYGEGVIADYEFCNGRELQVVARFGGDGGLEDAQIVFDIRIQEVYDNRTESFVGLNIEDVAEALRRARAWLYAHGHTVMFR